MKFSDSLAGGFHIVPKNGSFKIEITAQSFEELFRHYLKFLRNFSRFLPIIIVKAGNKQTEIDMKKNGYMKLNQGVEDWLEEDGINSGISVF